MKKVVSLALALVMVFACFSTAVFAVTTDAVLKIYVDTDKESYSKGDTVTFIVSYERSAEIGALGVPISIAFGFDSTVFEAIEDLSTVKTLLESTSFIYTGYPIAPTVNPAVSSAAVKAVTDSNDTAKGWDKMIMFKVGGDQCYDSFESKTAAFAFQLKVKEDASDTGCYEVGIADTAMNNNEVEINEELGSIYGTDPAFFDFANAVLFKGVSATVALASAEPVIKFSGYKACWGAYDKATGTADGDQSKGWNLGIEGTFAAEDIAIAFDETTGSSTNVSAVGVKVTAGDYTTVGETRYVQDNGDGTYTYRAVVTGIPGNVSSDAKITVQFYVTLNDAEILGETVKDIVLADQLTAANGRGMPAYAPV